MKNFITILLLFVFGLLIVLGWLSGAKPKEGYLNSYQIKADTLSIADSLLKLKKSKSDSLEILTLLKHFKIEKDEFSNENLQFYNHIYNPEFVNTNGAFLLFSKINGEASHIYLNLQYAADDWIFMKHVIFSIDGINYTIFPSEVSRDHKTTIWEWFREPMRQTDEEFLIAILTAKSIKYKIIGKDYSEVIILSQKQVLAMKETYTLFKLYGGKL